MLLLRPTFSVKFMASFLMSRMPKHKIEKQINLDSCAVRTPTYKNNTDSAVGLNPITQQQGQKKSLLKKNLIQDRSTFIKVLCWGID